MSKSCKSSNTVKMGKNFVVGDSVVGKIKKTIWKCCAGRRCRSQVSGSCKMVGQYNHRGNSSGH